LATSAEFVLRKVCATAFCVLQRRVLPDSFAASPFDGIENAETVWASKLRGDSGESSPPALLVSSA
jgi:hypothetical protein